MAPASGLLVVVQEADAEVIVFRPPHFAAIDRTVLHLQVEHPRQHLSAGELQLGAAVRQVEDRAIDQALLVVEEHPGRPHDPLANGGAAVGERIALRTRAFWIYAFRFCHPLSAARAATPSTSISKSGAANPVTIIMV